MRQLGFDEISISTNSYICISQLNENDNIIDLTIQAINEERNLDEQGIESNVKASFVSSWYSHVRNCNFLPIVRLIENCTSSLCKSINENLEIRFKVTNCWGAIYEKGDYSIEHNHFPCNFSAVVYLDVSEGCSNIFFGNKEIEVKKGTILIFPGFVNHYVPKTNTKRVVVAMNLMSAISPREVFDDFAPVGDYS